MSEFADKPPTILVIVDDTEIRYSLSRVLSSRKYVVTEAASGEQGIAIVKKGPPPDLVFLAAGGWLAWVASSCPAYSFGQPQAAGSVNDGVWHGADGH